MRVKRYIVNALPEAVTLIRTDLGKDAVILDTKEIRVGGFMGMFRKKKMEVIAAVEAGTAKSAAAVPQRSSSPDVHAMVEQILQQAGRGAAAEAAPAAIRPPATAAPAAAAAPQPAVERQAPPDSYRMDREQFIVNEIRELREYMAKLTKQQMDLRSLSEPLLALKERLLEQEMEPAWVDKLVDHLLVEQKLADRTFGRQEVWRLASEQLARWMEPFNNGEIDGHARVVHFVGPTGVGKTTSIAKLAADYSIKKGKKVGFITSDTYRIAAVDQLRTYANILNVPIEVVFSPMDLPKAYKGLAHCELIMMDTAGRNFRSELHVSEVNSLLQSNEPSETVLVLSLTGKSKDMDMIADRFSKYGVRKVLFTKLDETTVYGAVFNLVMKYELLPTHTASGQNVPDDIRRFRLSEYIELLLGDWNDE